MVPNASSLVTGIIVALLGGGLFVGWGKLRTSRPEATQLTVSAVKDIVFIQKGFIEDLEAKVERLSERLDAVEDEREQLQERVANAEAALAAAEAAKDCVERENRELTDRVQHLEEELTRMKTNEGGTP